jgi:hypothetical protein
VTTKASSFCGSELLVLLEVFGAACPWMIVVSGNALVQSASTTVSARVRDAFIGKGWLGRVGL